MSIRKWFVRGVVIAIIAGCAGAVAFYQRFTDPAAVRAMVLAKLQAMFPGAHVSVESASLRLFGGISVSGIRLARANDPDRLDVLCIPSAILHHDKEKVLDGELTLRKIELYRPILHIVRRPDGTWNLAGLSGKINPNVPLPAIVIHQGTLLLNDQMANDRADSAGHTMELSEVNVTLLNDPPTVLSIDGVARSDIAGKAQVRGQWQRGDGELALQIKAENVSLSQPLIDALARKCPAHSIDGLRLTGKANVQGELAFSLNAAEPFHYDVDVELTGATIAHPRLPLRLEDVHAIMHVSNGNLRVEKLTAHAGAAKVEGRGSAQLPAPDQTFEAHLEVKHLDVRPEFFEGLPEKLQALNRNYQPTGPVTIKVDCKRRNGHWETLASGDPSRALLMPENVRACFVKFPYPLEHVSGTIEHNFQTRRSAFDLSALAHNRNVIVKGYWQGEGPGVDSQFDVIADNVALDKTLLDALPPVFQKLAGGFHPTGKADVKALIKHVPGHAEKEFQHEYHIRFHEATVLWDGFPYPLENVTGLLDIFPNSYQICDFHGTHAGGLVTVNGRSVPVDGKPAGLILEITGQNVLLDTTMRKALTPMPSLVKTWGAFQPRGRIHFAAVIDRSTAQNEETDARVEVRGGDIEPVFFPYVFQDVAGKFRFYKNRLDLAQISAKHQTTRITIEHGTVDIHPKGGYYADLKEMQAQGLFLDREFIAAIPQCLRGAVSALNLKDPVAAKTRLVVAQDADPASPPDFFWDGQAWLKEAKFATGLEWSHATGTIASVGRFHRQVLGINGHFLFDRATLLKQSFHDVSGKFEVRREIPDLLLLGVRAPIFGGDLAGQMRVDFHSGMKYEMNLTASQIDLKDFGKHNLGAKSSLAGPLMGRLYLTGDGSGVDSLDGNGSLDVPNGKILDLPLLIDLLKFLGLRWPDRTLFEEMHAMFSIRGRRFAVRRLDLVGNVISLAGKGEVNLDGTDVQLDFYPSWARVDQLLPPLVRPIPPAIAKNLLTIEARGKISSDSKELKFYKKPLPAIVDPILNVRDRMLGNPTPGNPTLSNPGIDRPHFPVVPREEK
ncbi:MAG: hypothetical protein HY040_00800 [Planctomycetes bacterium]|nr:hypothetical protein [Planctomycetota bacterium]